MKRKKQIWMLVIILLFTLYSVSAFGIAPAKREISFASNFQQTFNGLIVNSNNEDLSITLKEIDPNNILELQETTISLSANEYEKTFHYTITLPEELPKDGLSANIQAFPEEDGNGIQMVLILESQIVILAPSEIKEQSKDIESIQQESLSTTESSESSTTFSKYWIFLFVLLVLISIILLILFLKKDSEG
jgi:hypothetical protein